MKKKQIKLITEVLRENKPQIYTEDMFEDGQRLMWLQIKQDFMTKLLEKDPHFDCAQFMEDCEVTMENCDED